MCILFFAAEVAQIIIACIKLQGTSVRVNFAAPQYLTDQQTPPSDPPAQLPTYTPPLQPPPKDEMCLDLSFLFLPYATPRKLISTRRGPRCQQRRFQIHQNYIVLFSRYPSCLIPITLRATMLRENSKFFSQYPYDNLW